ncbi:MAG: glycoside hydrolase family 65 protein [Lachnospiraceae bacterium]
MKRIYEKTVTSDPEEMLLAETIFHNANGYLGVRFCPEEGVPDGQSTIRGMYINGFYDITEMKQAEPLHGLIEEKQTMLNISDTQGIRLFVDGEKVSLAGRPGSEICRLDMDRGTTGRDFTWTSPDTGKEIRIRTLRLASYEMPELFVLRYEFTPINFSGLIRVESEQIGEVRNFSDPSDPRVAGSSVQYLTAEAPKIEDGLSLITAHTSRSGLSVCTGVSERLAAAQTAAGTAGAPADTAGENAEIPDRVGEISGTVTVMANPEKAAAIPGECAVHGTSVVRTYTVRAGQNQSFVLEKAAFLSDSLRHPDPAARVRSCFDEFRKNGSGYYFRRQEERLARFWQDSELTIEGDDDTALAVTYNMYQLIQSVSRDTFGNIAAKGLSGEGYEGHYFWDTEMYMQPFFILTAPNLAANLIRFRYRILPQARINAREMGHQRGALYPWRTIMGKECSGYFPSGTAAYHINGDIAYSVVQYYLATGDRQLLEDCGEEILVETARLWLDTGVYVGDSFQIQDVTGPDEYTCLVDNNYYTNVVAQYNLQWAVKGLAELAPEAARRLREKLNLTDGELKEMERAAEHMYLPYDEKLGIHPQDDSFLKKKYWDASTIPEEDRPLLLHYHPLYLYRHQICKQADTVLAHFIREEVTDPDKMKRSYEYYEKVTTHDSSLSTCIFSIMAARLGDLGKARAYLGDSARLDLFNTHKNTKDGIHTANMGGTTMAIIYGFGGLRLSAERGLVLRPRIPEGWKSYSFRFLYRGRKIRVSVTQEKAVISLLSGDPVELTVNDRREILKNDLTAESAG